jgi:hypothetical protein
MPGWTLFLVMYYGLRYGGQTEIPGSFVVII